MEKFFVSHQFRIIQFDFDKFDTSVEENIIWIEK